ncbi:sulfatase-like hydrolase/transferase [Lacticaseibacillus jixianensis]|nr:sulfatase-like hydrolase/transferase [Lacticaseibacillus jixianensis]
MARMDVGIRRYMSRFTAVKLLLTLVLVSMPNILFGTPKHALIAMGEIVVAYFIYIFMGRRLWILGYLISSLATFLVITQEWVRYFSGSYTTKIMLDNLANIKALGPALPRYILIVALVGIISFFPAKFNQYPKIPWRFVFLGLGTVFMWGLFYTGRRTAVTDSVSLVREYQEAAKTTRRLEAAQDNRAKIIRSFEKTSVPGGISLGKEKYNVIVVFAEGTSRRTIEETGAKYPGLMPNLQRFSQETINFTNYFNHTAPTYKGLRGQLNSAFQYYEGYEDAKNAAQIKARTKTPLIGLPQILRNHSYTAKFINPEPKHEQFTPYLQSLGFNSVISDSPKVWSRSGNTTYLSDKNNFRLLMNQAEKLNSRVLESS